MYCEQDGKKTLSEHAFDTCKKGFINKQGSYMKKIANDVEKPL